jgi:hypothetical protein
MAHVDAREGKWKGNWRMEWVACTLHTTAEHGVSSIITITTADAHTSAASSPLKWRPRRFKWTRPFRRKTKSGFCACANTFQTQSTTSVEPLMKQIVMSALCVEHCYNVQRSEGTSVSYVAGSPKVVIYSNQVSLCFLSLRWKYCTNISLILCQHLYS